MTGRLLFHVAIADDWEACVALGSYEAATEGRSLDEEGYIHATTAEAIQHVLDTRYRQIRLPLLLIALDSDALDVPVQWEPPGHPRILGPIPCTDPAAIVSITPLARETNRWLAPTDPGLHSERQKEQ